MDSQQATNVVSFKQTDLAPPLACTTPQCVEQAMANALGDYQHSVTGTVVHGRAFLRGTVRKDSDREWIERSVRQLACVVDVINGVSIEHPTFQRPDRRSSPLYGAGGSGPLLYLSDYCSLDQNALELLIGKSLALLEHELGEVARPAAEAIIFYYLWHEEAAMVDIALPTVSTLERRPTNMVRGTVLPEMTRWTRPPGGISGLKAARRRLARRCGADPSDPMFRVWQSVPLSNGALPANWLETPLKTAQ